jgi:hypothetical protein
MNRRAAGSGVAFRGAHQQLAEEHSMITLIRTLARLAFAVLTITLCLPAASSRAQNFTFYYVSATGSGSVCTLAQPCSSGGAVLSLALATANSRIVCLSPVDLTNPNVAQGSDQSNSTVEMDCPEGASLQAAFWNPDVSNDTVKFRNVTFTNLGNTSSAIQFFSSGTLIFENCIFETGRGTSLDIEPNGPLNVVIRNSRISNNASGMLLKPAAGGSIKATLDHVVITSNNGGGIKTDSTNGAVNLDITDSEISNNTANGINLVGGDNQNMLNLSRTVIAKNTLTGLQTNGATAAALVETTLFDTNASATTILNGSHILTYGNNRIVGSSGSGFTATAPLQ